MTSPAAGGFAAPLWDAMLRHRERERASLHTPGHHGGGEALRPLMGDALGFDLTELHGTGDLLHPHADDPIAAAEQLMADACHAAHTCFSPGGCSLALAAMLRAGAGYDADIIVDRRCHVSALNAMAHLDLKPVFISPRSQGPFCRVAPRDLHAARELAPNARALLLTSPDYTGACCDIPAMRALCDELGLRLLVDGAHGAHLAYHDGGALHPMRLGAHLLCESMHKTLPTLTGAALLHASQGSGLDGHDLRDALRLFCSTSPSYLVMASMDLCRAHMLQNPDWSPALLRQIDGLDMYLQSHVGISLTRCPPPCDPFRLTLNLPGGGAQDAADELRRRGVYIEAVMGDMLILIPHAESADLGRGPHYISVLAGAMRDIFATRPRPSGAQGCGAYDLPTGGGARRPAMTPRRALSARRERVPLDEALGRIAAQPVLKAPPCSPVLLPGEIVTAEHVEMFSGINMGIYVII